MYKTGKWSKEENEILKSLAQTHICKELVTILNRSSSSIYHHAKVLGLEIKKEQEICEKQDKLKEAYTNIWTNDDIETLKKLINSKQIKEIAEILNRSENAVYRKALSLNLISTQWNEDKTIQLKELFGKYSIKQIAKIMGTSVSTINRKIKLIKEGKDIVIKEKVVSKKRKNNNNSKWNIKEIEMIRLLGKRYPCEIISDILQREKKEIYYISEKNNIFIKSKYEYEKELIKYYIENSPDFTIEELEKIFRKSRKTLMNILKEIKIEYQNSRNWTEEQVDYLIELWGYKSIQVISQITGKSIISIRNKARRLGLGPMISNNDKLTVSIIADILNIDRNTIINTWKKNGLHLKKIHLTQKKSYWVTTIENLYRFLEYNQDKWDSKNLEPKIFGEEPEWLKLKRKLDFVNIGNKPLSIDEMKLIGFLIYKNTSLKEISNILKRPVNEIIEIIERLKFNGNIRLFFEDEHIQQLNKNNYIEFLKRNN